MAVTIDLSQTPPSAVVPVVSPVAELQACLHSLAEPDHHFDARPWLAHVSALLPDSLADDLAGLAPLWARRRSRLLLPLRREASADLAADLHRLAQVDHEDFFDSTARTIQGSDFDTTGLSVRPERHRDFLESCERRAYSRGELARRLVDDPGRLRDDLLDALERCGAVFFDAEWTKLSGRLSQEVDRLVEARRRSIWDLMTAVSPGASRVGESAVVRFDKLQSRRVAAGRPVLVVPTIHGRPHLVIRDDQPYPVVIQAPVMTGGSVSVEQIRRRIAVLEDKNRLALCRHLVNEAITTSDLSRRTGMAASQVSRHLSRLREADLLLSEREGRYVYHRLDVASLMQIGPQLLRSIEL